MKTFLYILILAAGLSSAFANEERRLVWPPPPDKARIEYMTSVREHKDLGIEKGFFSKAFDFLFGEEEKPLGSPFGIHVENERVYITDISTKLLNVFDKKNNKILKIEGSETQKFLYPIDIVTDKDENIYVSDSVRAKVFVFNKDGDFMYYISPKELQRPVGLALGADSQKLYIVDTLSSQIHVVTLKGKLLYSIGKLGSGNAEFNRPTFIDVSPDGRMYVTDSMNHRVQILDRDGNFLNKFGHLGQEIGSFGSPRGISLDSHGNIYVTDTMFNNIQIFNQSGELLLVLGRYGENNGEFALPEDISIAAGNKIYVTDVNNRRVEIFRLLEQAQTRSSR